MDCPFFFCRSSWVISRLYLLLMLGYLVGIEDVWLKIDGDRFLAIFGLRVGWKFGGIELEPRYVLLYMRLLCSSGEE